MVSGMRVDVNVANQRVIAREVAESRLAAGLCTRVDPATPRRMTAFLRALERRAGVGFMP